MEGDEDADLAVVRLSEAVPPLASDADRVVALLGESGTVEHQDAVRIAEIATDLAVELGPNAGVLPLALTGEPLKALSWLVVGDRDGFDGLAPQVAGQPFEVHLRQPRLLLPIEKRREGPRGFRD